MSAESPSSRSLSAQPFIPRSTAGVSDYDEYINGRKVFPARSRKLNDEVNSESISSSFSDLNLNQQSVPSFQPSLARNAQPFYPSGSRSSSSLSLNSSSSQQYQPSNLQNAGIGGSGGSLSSASLSSLSLSNSASSSSLSLSTNSYQPSTLSSNTFSLSSAPSYTPTYNVAPIPQSFVTIPSRVTETDILPQIEGLPPLNHHLYSHPSAHTANLPPNVKTSHHFFVNDDIRQRLLQRNESKNSFRVEGTEPLEVGTYHTISKIDDNKDRMSSVFRFHTSLYKGINSLDGLVYALRRVEGFRSQVTVNSEFWKRINHPNIITFRDCFSTKQFGDNSLVFVYDFHGNSQTLHERQFSGSSTPLTEKSIWSIIIQIVSAMRVIHATGRACRVINSTKIIFTSKNRIRLGGIGMPELLSFDTSKNQSVFQQEDFTSLGYLILALACNSLNSLHNVPKAMDLISRNFSPSLKSIVDYLISVNIKSMDELIRWIAPRMMAELESVQYQNDLLEEELSKELENGRILRILCKLGFINDRPEYAMDPAWSETGDRYLIMLFRDYIFHQIDENNDPILSLSHVITCLNKLDAGYPEKIMLMSRDEQSCIIVSYKDLKRCVEEAFQELQRHRKPLA